MGVGLARGEQAQGAVVGEGGVGGRRRGGGEAAGLPEADHRLQPCQHGGQQGQNQGVHHRGRKPCAGMPVGHRAQVGRKGGDERGQGLRCVLHDVINN